MCVCVCNLNKDKEKVENIIAGYEIENVSGINKLAFEIAG